MFGITTFAPAAMPASRPPLSIVPNAVVAGSKRLGLMRRNSDSKNIVSFALPAGKLLNGVSFCGTNGPIPHISGENSSTNLRSLASVAEV